MFPLILCFDSFIDHSKFMSAVQEYEEFGWTAQMIQGKYD